MLIAGELVTSCSLKTYRYGFGGFSTQFSTGVENSGGLLYTHGIKTRLAGGRKL
jgi:hypothetical protein